MITPVYQFLKNSSFIFYFLHNTVNICIQINLKLSTFHEKQTDFFPQIH